ncbi:hypothetical protein [Pseudomonas jilinensis]|uniref:Solute-binding protein family 3/N-terminal domain-containing protein n=1 Tax=Pseudomonas jilinensis TaxID=2078689 RepID=A0A396S153_9PSED|nr:hypothetical protein [Pseudomonas jilinensis]RHW22236.1 hypothetical protein C2846_04225 [Pseudomonas jilinensis]
MTSCHASPLYRWLYFCCLTALLSFSGPVFSDHEQSLTLRLAGTPESFGYTAAILSHALRAQGVVTDIHRAAGNLPMTRLEYMLENGTLSAAILGRTEERDRRLLPIAIGMTDNLVNQRILFIPQGTQATYDNVHSLEDFVRLNKVAGMGQAWADRLIWEANGLAVQPLDGDWRRLYRMVASQARGIDYLPRAAYEIAAEWPSHPDLAVEQHLVLVYEQDHILYVSPAEPELHQLLLKALNEAARSGLIRRLAREHYAEVFEPPVNLGERRAIVLIAPEREHPVIP